MPQIEHVFFISVTLQLIESVFLSHLGMLSWVSSVSAASFLQDRTGVHAGGARTAPGLAPLPSRSGSEVNGGELNLPPPWILVDLVNSAAVTAD